MKPEPAHLDLSNIRAGTMQVVKMPVARALAGHEVFLWVHVVRGLKAGPTLALLGGVHGDEWLGPVVLRRLVAEVHPEELSGTLLIVPVSNPPALEIGQRTVPDEAGGTDLNRVFPGHTTLITDRLAAMITREVLSQADGLLDFHQGGWGVAWSAIEFPADIPDTAVRERAGEMAHAFGFACIHRAQVVTGRLGTGTACGYVGTQLKIPGVVVSIGGVGFADAVESGWIEASVSGVKNVMRHLGMMTGISSPAPRRLVFEKGWHVRPSVGGFLEPSIGVERMLTAVEEGELLGRVLSPYTFEVLEELVAPKPGILICIARAYPVQPGNWAYGAADLTDASTVWLEEG